MKQNIKTLLVAGLVSISFLIIIYAIPESGADAKYITVDLYADFDNGRQRNITVSYPEYASLYLVQGYGNHSLNTWEYCFFKGWLRCSRTLMFGVNYFEYR